MNASAHHLVFIVVCQAFQAYCSAKPIWSIGGILARLEVPVPFAKESVSENRNFKILRIGGKDLIFQL